MLVFTDNVSMIAPANIILGQSQKNVFSGIKYIMIKHKEVINCEHAIANFLPTFWTMKMQSIAAGIAVSPPSDTFKNRFLPIWPTYCIKAWNIIPVRSL